MSLGKKFDEKFYLLIVDIRDVQYLYFINITFVECVNLYTLFIMYTHCISQYKFSSNWRRKVLFYLEIVIGNFRLLDKNLVNLTINIY